jgi:hypothetical protein
MLPGGPAEHLVFSDGLASVSVFVERGHNPDGQRRGDDAATLGTSSAYSIAVQGYRITAVGEVPPATVRAIAQAIRGAGGEPQAAEGLTGIDIQGTPRDAPRAHTPGPFATGSINGLSGFGGLGNEPGDLAGPGPTAARGFGTAGGGARRH